MSGLQRKAELICSMGAMTRDGDRANMGGNSQEREVREAIFGKNLFLFRNFQNCLDPLVPPPQKKISLCYDRAEIIFGRKQCPKQKLEFYFYFNRYG